MSIEVTGGRLPPGLREALGEALFGEGRGEAEKPMTDTQKEAAVMTLREHLPGYEKCPYKVGDIVTPRKTSNTRGRGEPHLVVEVFDPPVRLTNITDTSDATSQNYLFKADMRVLCIRGNKYVIAYAGEAWNYEPYTGPGME